MGKFNMEKLNQNGLGHLWDEIKLSIYNDCKENIGRRMVKFVKQCMKEYNELSSPEGFIASFELSYILNARLTELNDAIDLVLKSVEYGPDRSLMQTIEEKILDAYEKIGQEAAKRMAYLVSHIAKDTEYDKLGNTSFSFEYESNSIEFNMTDSSTVELCVSIIDKAKTYGMKTWGDIVRIIAFNIEPEADDLESCETSAIAPPDCSVSKLLETAIEQEFSEEGIVRAMRATIRKYHYAQHPHFKEAPQFLYNGIDKMYNDDDDEDDED